MTHGPDERYAFWDIRGWSRDAVISEALRVAHSIPDEEPFPQAWQGLIRQIRRARGTPEPRLIACFTFDRHRDLVTRGQS